MSNIKKLKIKSLTQKKFNKDLYSRALIVTGLTCIFLMISSIWYDYANFYAEILITLLLIVASFLIRKLLLHKISLGFSLLFFISFFIFNYNYVFIFAICAILGILGLHFIEPELNIPQWVYSLIPVLILGHIIWFNVLPFGFDGSWTLDVGSVDDMDASADLYIIDNDRVLSDSWSYGDKTWREFRKDGSFQIGFNTPVYLENKTVEISMEYEADSPIYINGELFYDPAWGSSVELMNEGEVYVYGADVFNLTRDYENTSLGLFLNVTNSTSLEEYVNNVYFVDLQTFVYEKVIENETIEVAGINGFLEDRGFNSSEDFMLFELNSGLYPKPQLRFNYSNIEEFMYAKYPQGVAMKDFTGLYPQLEEEMNTRYVDYINSLEAYPDWTDDIHTINTTFRGPVTFYGVFNDTIELSLEKKDTNDYNGSDYINISIINLNHKIIYEYQIKDNDNITAPIYQESTWKVYNLSFDINKSGIYKIEMTRNPQNKYEDFHFKNTNINTNKFLISGDILPLNPINLYFKNGDKTNFYYWKNGKDQNIILNNKSIYLTPNYQRKTFTYNLNNYSQINLTKGHIWIRSSNKYSIWKDGTFEIPDKPEIIFKKNINTKNKNYVTTQIQNITIDAMKETKITKFSIIYLQ